MTESSQWIIVNMPLASARSVASRKGQDFRQTSKAHEVLKRAVAHLGQDRNVRQWLCYRIGQNRMQKHIDDRHALDIAGFAFDGLNMDSPGWGKTMFPNSGDAASRRSYGAGLVVIAPLRFVRGDVFPK